MYELPKKVKNLAPYEPVTGNYQIRLDANESFIETPEWLRRQIADVVMNVAFNRYPDPDCTELCRAFAQYFNIRPESVVAGNGSDELISLIVGYFIEPGKTMVVVSPDFSMYQFYAQLGGVKVEVFEKMHDSLSLDVDALIAFAKKKHAKLMIFSNPCNPTSLAAPMREMEKILAALPDCLVIADEAYMEFAGSGYSILERAYTAQNLLVLKTCSKAFGMAAIRLGFAVANPDLVRTLKAIKSPYNVNTVTQEIGRLVLLQKAYLQECTEKICASRVDLYEALTALSQKQKTILQVYNTCTNFVFLRLSDPKVIFEKLKEQGIAVRCLGHFLRITAGSKQENARFISALSSILEGA